MRGSLLRALLQPGVEVAVGLAAQGGRAALSAGRLDVTTFRNHVFLPIRKGGSRRLCALFDLYSYFSKLTPFTTPTFATLSFVWNEDFGWFWVGLGDRKSV